MQEIVVGDWRKGPEPMRVVSGRPDRETIHFEAPPAGEVDAEVERFLRWWGSGGPPDDGLLRTALAHLWFVTIHPFEDGNGRIARAVADMALAQDEGTQVRLYSMSAQIAEERKQYYAELQRAQGGDGDVTDWFCWFLGCSGRAMLRAEQEVDRVLAKARFWQRVRSVPINERQLKVVNRLLDTGPGGFEGGITTRKYVGLTGTSRATAQREIAVLVSKGLLVPLPGGGRSSAYEIAW
jgi:Fic family protein